MMLSLKIAQDHPWSVSLSGPKFKPESWVTVKTDAAMKFIRYDGRLTVEEIEEIRDNGWKAKVMVVYENIETNAYDIQFRMPSGRVGTNGWWSRIYTFIEDDLIAIDDVIT